MCLCICVFVCIHECVCACIYVIWACTCTHTHTHTHGCSLSIAISISHCSHQVPVTSTPSSSLCPMESSPSPLWAQWTFPHPQGRMGVDLVPSDIGEHYLELSFTRRASILGTPGLSGRSVTSVAMATSHYDATEYIELLKNSFMEYLNGNVVSVCGLLSCSIPHPSCLFLPGHGF